MKSKRFAHAYLFLVVLFSLFSLIALTACSDAQPPTPTHPPPTASSTPEPLPSNTPAPTVFLSPTPTPLRAITADAAAYLLSGFVEALFDDGFTVQGERLYYRSTPSVVLKIGDAVDVFVVKDGGTLYATHIDLIVLSDPENASGD